MIIDDPKETKRLNLDTFNEILFSALKDQSPQKKEELLLHELQMAYGVKITHMEKVIEDLNNGLPYHGDLEQVNIIDQNCAHLGKRLDELREQYPELNEKKEAADEE